MKTRQKLGIYTESEMKIMGRWNKEKSRMFMPILEFLDKKNVTPNSISLISALIAIIFLIFSIYLKNPIIFAIGIWLHVLMDGFDGALARYQKKESFSGTIIDAIGDYCGIITASIFLVYFNLADSTNVLLYTIGYTLLIINSIYLILLAQRLKFLIRPRFFIYILLTIMAIISVVTKNSIQTYSIVTNFIVLAFSILIWCQVLLEIIKIIRVKNR